MESGLISLPAPTYLHRTPPPPSSPSRGSPSTWRSPGPSTSSSGAQFVLEFIYIFNLKRNYIFLHFMLNKIQWTVRAPSPEQLKIYNKVFLFLVGVKRALWCIQSISLTQITRIDKEIVEAEQVGLFGLV